MGSSRQEIDAGLLEICHARVPENIALIMLSEIKRLLSSQGVEIIDKEAELPKLKSLTGEASIEEKAAFLLGVEDAKEQMLSNNFHKHYKLVE